MDRIKDFLTHNQMLEDPESTPYADWLSAATADNFQPQHKTGPNKRGR